MLVGLGESSYNFGSRYRSSDLPNELVIDMELFTIASIVIVLSALFGFINARFLKLPNTIGMMLVAIAFTLVLFASKFFTDRLFSATEHLIGLIDFETVLLDVLLGFLLFAGALHTNFGHLHVQRWPVLVFATLGVLVSTLLVGTLVYFVFPILELHPKYIHCLLFGALISPTDPIAVLGILKKANVPKQLETKIVGESLFNDGVGVVVFLTIMSIASAGSVQEKVEQQGTAAVSSEVVDIVQEVQHQQGEADVLSILRLFGQEVIGGLAIGALLGYLTFGLLKSIDNYEIEVLITLACVMGGYSLAAFLHVSAPLAMVVAGLIVGNDAVRDSAMSRATEDYVDRFWELVDMLMNAVLFVLIGLEMVILPFEVQYLWAALLAIVIVLLSRFLSLLLPVRFFARRLDFVPHTTTLMTWGGLRGGISIALALGLPESMNRELFLAVTYGVVVFSIVTQGLTVGMLARKLLGTPQVEPITSH